MRKSLVGGVVAALALGGAAMAWAEGSSTNAGDERDGVDSLPRPPLVAFGEGPDGSFAEDLAAELDVSPEEVEQALEAVAEKRRAEHQREMAEMLSEHLDGVSVEDIEAALAVAEEQMHEAIENGEPPGPGQFTETLAQELGLSEDEVSDALAEMREETFSAHRDEFEKGLDERLEELPPIAPPRGGPGVSFAFPPA